MIKVNLDFCVLVVGFLGKCNNRINDDFKLKFGFLLILEIGGIFF